MNIFLICLGGSIGALSRFYLSSLFQKSENFEIPLGILVVNILGCFLLGLFYHLMDSNLERYLTPFLFVGFLGAFTTFSAFSAESLEMLNSGSYNYFFIYTSITIVAGILFAFLGFSITK